MKMNISTREAYMIATALYREVKHQQSLPIEKQEWIMTEDMKALLQGSFSPYLSILAAIDRGAGRAPIDLNDADRGTPKVLGRRSRPRDRGAIGQRH